MTRFTQTQLKQVSQSLQQPSSGDLVQEVQVGGLPQPTCTCTFETKAVALGHAKRGDTSGDTSEQAACSMHWAAVPDQPVALWAQQSLANVEASTVWVMYSCPGFITTKMCQQASYN